METIQSLYSTLYPLAKKVTSKELLGAQIFNYNELKEIAHDITIDFLYFSRSFREYYDWKLPIQPFFISYTRKKCKNYKFTKIAEANKYSPLPEDDFDFHDEFKKYKWIELQNRLSFFHTQLSQYTIQGLNLGDVFEIYIISLLEEGEVNYRFMSKLLHTELKNIHPAVKKMRYIIKQLKNNGY